MTRIPVAVRRVAVTAALAVLVTAGTARADAAWDKLVKAAQAEGKIEVILSGQMPRRLTKVMPEFQKKYGVKVNFQTGSGRKHASRILAERRAGRYTIDAWIGGAVTGNTRLIPNKALTPIQYLLVDPEVKDPAKWYKGRMHYADAAGKYIFAWGASPLQQVSFNTSMVKAEQITSFESLLDPKWKGKIVSWPPNGTGSAPSVVSMWLHPRIGEQWFRRFIKEMNVTFVTDARQGAEWVATGRFPIGVFGLSTQADALRGQGFPVQGFLPHAMKEGEFLTSSAANIMALDRAPNPNATKLFVNWALSREAHVLFLRAGKDGDSLRVDVPNDEVPPDGRIRRDVDYYVAFDDPRWINEQGEILKKVTKIMEEAGIK
jgi:ABC-type Fe3+ transport system substrate-binding protein